MNDIFTSFGKNDVVCIYIISGTTEEKYVYGSPAGSSPQSSYSELSTNQLFFKKSTSFGVCIHHKYMLIFASDILSKGESCGYQTETNIVLYF